MKTKKTDPIPPALAAAYRAAAPATVATQVEGLRAFLAHRAPFVALGHAAIVAAAERAWWRDAVVLAAPPASDAAEARGKLAALRPALDGRTWHSVADGHRAAVAMIAAAVEAEHRRWSLDDPSGAPACHGPMRPDPGPCPPPTREPTLTRSTTPAIEAWQAAVYGALTRPSTLADALGCVSTLTAHRSHLRAIGDRRTAEAVAAQLWIALVKLAAVAASDGRALARKAGVLGAHRALRADAPLGAAPVAAALAAQAEALAPDPRDRARIDRLLRGHAR